MAFNIAQVGVDKKSGAPIIQRSSNFIYNNDPNGTRDIFYHFGSRLRSSSWVNPNSTSFVTASRLNSGGIISPADNAVDNNPATSLFVNSTDETDGFQVQFNVAPFKLLEIQLNTNDPNWTVEGSNDGTNWSNIAYPGFGNLGNDWYLLSVTNNTFYSYYRILHNEVGFTKTFGTVKFFGEYQSGDIAPGIVEDATFLATHRVGPGIIYLPDAGAENFPENYYCTVVHFKTGEYTYQAFPGGSTSVIDNTNGVLRQGEQLLAVYDNGNWELFKVGSGVDLTTKGTLITSDGVDTTFLSVGPNGSFLVADSGEPNGLRYQTLNLSTIAQPTGTVNFNNQRITGVGAPTSPTDAVTKNYADSIAAGFDPKASCDVATTGTLNATTGDTWTPAGSGPSKTLTSNSTSATLDTILLQNGLRVLVKDQTNAADNGIYIVSGVGTAVTLTRTSDFNNSINVTPGAFTFITNGVQNGATGFILLGNGTLVVDTNDLNFSQFAGAGAVTLTSLPDTNFTPLDGSSTGRFVGYNHGTGFFELYEKSGTAIDDLVKLEDVGGNPGLPAVDGTQVTISPTQVSPLTAKGDVWVYNGSNDTRLPLGTDNSLLFANSATATGLEYKGITSDFITLNHTATDLEFNVPLAFDNIHSVEFPGTNAAIANWDSGRYDLPIGFTVEFWVKTFDGSSGNQILVSHQQGTNGWEIVQAGTSLTIRIDGSFGGIPGFFSGATNNWVHVAIVINTPNLTAYAYKNGTFFNSTLVKFGSNINYEDDIGLVLGAEAGLNNTIDTTNSLFNGRIDELRIWNDVRSAGEITSNYNINLPDSEKDISLVAEWRFNEGTGNAIDSVTGAEMTGTYVWVTDVPYQNQTVYNLAGLTFPSSIISDVNTGDFLRYDGVAFTPTDPTGSSIGKLLKVENVGGVAGLPSLDGSQLTNLNVAPGQGSPLTTKGDIYIFDTANTKLSVGANGTVLSANSITSEGLEYSEVRDLLREAKEITSSPYTIQANDERQVLITTAAANIELPDTLSTGFFTTIYSNQVGDISFTAGGGATIVNNTTLRQNDTVIVSLATSNTWLITKIEDSILSTKGDILSFSDKPAVLPVGANGQVIVANNASDIGFRWEDRADAGDLIYSYEVPEVILGHTADDIFRSIGTEKGTVAFVNPVTDGKITATTNSSGGLGFDNPDNITDNTQGGGNILLNGSEFIQWQFNNHTIQPFKIWVYDDNNVVGDTVYNVEVSNDGIVWTEVGQLTLIGTNTGVWTSTTLNTNGYFSYLRLVRNNTLSTGTDTWDEIKLFGFVKDNAAVGEIFAVGSTGITPIAATSNNQILIADSGEPTGVRWDDINTIVANPFSSQRLDISSALQLTGSNAKYLYIAATGGTQDVILTNPPSTNDFFYIVNRDGANNIQIKETAAGGVIQVLNSNAPVCQVHYDGTEWQLIHFGTI